MINKIEENICLLAEELHKNCCKNIHSNDYCNFHLTTNWNEPYRAIFYKRALKLVEIVDIETAYKVISIIK